MRLWSRFSESGQMRAKSKSDATDMPGCCPDGVSSHERLVASVEAGSVVDALLLSQEVSESNEGSVGIETVDGPCLVPISRMWSFSCRARASCRAKGRRHSLHTNGLDPVSVRFRSADGEHRN